MFRFIILAVALVAGGAAAWIALAMRSEAPIPVVVQNPIPAATGEVLVAATELAPGKVLSQESVRWQAWPDGAAEPGHITRAARPDAMQTLIGTLVRTGMVMGEPIREDRLVSNNGLLSSMLRPGKRAVAVRITAENTAGGFILPNDRVDVLHTLGGSDKPQGPRDFATNTILTNITVLAVDQTLDETDKRAEIKAKTVAALGKTATLELDPQQAELVTTAQASGTLSLTLRSTADNAEVPTVPRQVVLPRTERAVVIVRGGSATTPSPKAP